MPVSGMKMQSLVGLSAHSLHKRVTPLPGQKCPQLPVLETCSALMPSKLMPKSTKAQNVVAAKLLMS